MRVVEETVGPKASALVPGSIGQLMAQAQAEGKAEGKAEMLELLLVRRFGPLSEEISARVRGGSTQQLELWFDRGLDASSLDAVFGA